MTASTLEPAKPAAFKPRSRREIAERLARDIPEGWAVNLGIGVPTLVADYIPPEREVLIQSENGILGMGPAPAPNEADPWLINAGKQMVTLRPGGSYFHHGDSFAMIRGGHLDLCVLGAFQVAANGDLANWALDTDDGKPPAVGGAMDLAVGAKRIWVMVEHETKDGQPRLLERCTYPLTAPGVVSRVYTSLGVFAVEEGRFRVLEMVEGLSREELQARTGARLAE